MGRQKEDTQGSIIIEDKSATTKTQDIHHVGSFLPMALLKFSIKTSVFLISDE